MAEGRVPGLQPLIDFTSSLGAWAPLSYIPIYACGALVGIPAWTLTMASGALFGPLLGFVIASISAVLAAAAGFLIARYLLRDRIERIARKRRLFRALDAAVRKGDWRVVALVRLSPVVPYMLSNYLFGITAVRFWPYLVAGWVATLPGTLLYVMLGHAGRRGLEAAGSDSPFQAGEWLLLGLGVAASAALVIYLTRLAKNALREEDQGTDDPRAGEAARVEANRPNPTASR